MFAMAPTLPQRLRGFHAFLWCGCLHHWLASVAARSTTSRSRCQYWIRHSRIARSGFDAATVADGARNALTCGNWNKRPVLYCYSILLILQNDALCGSVLDLIRLPISIHALIVQHIRLGPGNVACSNAIHTLVVVLIPLIVTRITSKSGVVTAIQRPHVIAHRICNT